MGFREKLNLRTNKRLKSGQVHTLSNDQLLAMHRSTRRSVASAFTGIGWSSVLSLGNPAFLGAALVNTWQGTVASINKHRVKREVAVRKVKDAAMQRLINEKDKPFKDIVIGATVKTVLGGVALGVAGADTAFDNAANLAVAVKGHLLGTADSAALPIETLHTNVPQFDGTSPEELLHSHPHADEFAAGHPHGEQVDTAVHSFIGGLGDAVAKQIGEETGNTITTDSSWLQLTHLHDVHGSSGSALAIQTAGVGAQAELLQFPTMAVEVAVDERLEERQKERAEQFLQREKSSLNVPGGYS